MNGFVWGFVFFCTCSLSAVAPSRRPIFSYVTRWPDNQDVFHRCRNRDLRACNRDEQKAHLERTAPVAAFLQEKLNWTGKASLDRTRFIWLEVPLEAIGQQLDFDFAAVPDDSVVVNRFPRLAVPLNSKHGFAQLAAGMQCVPETLVGPIKETEVRKMFGVDQLGLWKPGFGGAGEGIMVFRGADEALDLVLRKSEDGEPYVLQTYIANPMLIAGHRFSIRLYFFVSSLAPLRVWVFNDGIVKFIPAPFTDDEGKVLTQRAYREFGAHQHEKARILGQCLEGECRGTRWTVRGLLSHITSEQMANQHFHMGDSQQLQWSEAAFWREVSSCTLEAITRAAAHATHRRNSFQLLGVDFDMDESGRLFFLEANVSPFLGAQTAWEKQQKDHLLGDVFGFALNGNELSSERWTVVTTLE